MIRKRERVIGTLLVWIGILIAMGMTLDRMNYINIRMQNNYYNSGSVLTGANQQEATQLLETLQIINSELFFQVQAFTRAELTPYLPYFLLICAVLLIGGVLSTYFIWRSVVVPEALSEAIAAQREEDERETSGVRSLANLLDDDGEILTPDADFEPEHNHREELT